MSSPPERSLPAELQSKHDALLDWLTAHAPVVVAFSAGVDSTVLAHAAQLALGERARAVTAVSPSLARSEREAAARLAEQIGIAHRFLETDEFQRPEYRRNAPDRCFFCKDTLYTAIEQLAQTVDETVVNGANLDDRGDHRPGMRAAAEHQVRSPLLELGLSKQEVRELARFWNLPVWDKPASPCLSSRIRYGLEVTPERTLRIDRAEAWLRSEAGLREFRVRLEPHEIARIEVAPEHLARLTTDPLRSQLVENFRHLGFSHVTIDLAGFQSGSMNAMIPVEQLERWETPPAGTHQPAST